MKLFIKSRIAEIKGVRVNYDHVEQIIEWFKDENLNVEISALGIDHTYKNFDSIDSLIKARGKRPGTIAITGKKEDQTIQLLVTMQYCIIETINRKGDDLEFKIVRLMRRSVPRLFKLFPFKWFVWLLFLMFISPLVAFFIFERDHLFVITYSVYPVTAFIVAGLYNNKVNGINLIYSFEKSSFWARKRDDIILLILSTLIMVPIGSAIWEYLIKPFLESRT